MPTIEIYTQPWCPYCTQALALLRRTGIPFTEIEAPPGSARRAEATQRSGRTTVPQVFVNGAHIGDCEALQALDRAGRLTALLTA